MTDQRDPHPVTGLDDVVHQRVRLGILTVAHQARRVEFGFLRTALGLTAGNLSQHLAVLEKAGLVEIEKGYEGKRARTWLSSPRLATALCRTRSPSSSGSSTRSSKAAQSRSPDLDS